MPFFKTTQNIFKTPWEDELFDPNWMNYAEIVLPQQKKWDYKKDLKIEDVQVWEQIYFASGGTGLYAAWDPYAEFYLITKNLHTNNKNDIYTEVFYGKNASNRAYKKAIELGMPIQVNKLWVENDEMWLHA